MKKQNRNAFAYVRQPNVQPNEEVPLANKNNKPGLNQTIYNQIIGQMDQGITTYISKIINKNQKQQKKRSAQKSLNHERTKSYADILVQTPSSSKNPADKGHSHRGSHPSTQINNIFFSLNNSPTNQKPISLKSAKNMNEKHASSSFLETLDTYILDLSVNKGTAGSLKKIDVHEQQNTGVERKSIQKSRENSANNLKIIERLQASMRRQKQLKIANQILASENQKIKSKLRKNKQIVKTTMHELYQYAQALSLQLKQQKRERRKLQQFISQFQSKFIMLRPERKTSGARPRLQDYLLQSQTTQQDDSQVQQDCASEINKSKRKQVLPRSTAKNSRVSGFHIEQLSAMLASKNFQFQDEDSQNYQA